MKKLRVTRVLIVAAMLAFGCSTLEANAETLTLAPGGGSTGGLMIIGPLEESYLGGSEISLMGTITNACKAPLPPNSEFVFYFDDKPFASFQITSALKIKGTQNFATKGMIPKLSPPAKNITSLDFAIFLPGAESDGKTSPCEPTFVPTSPS
jgi:hypothetical protein